MEVLKAEGRWESGRDKPCKLLRLSEALSLWRRRELSHGEQLTGHAALEAEMATLSDLLLASPFQRNPQISELECVLLSASKCEVGKPFL